MKNTINVQLFQFTPTTQLLSESIDPIKSALIDASLFKENSITDSQVIEGLQQACTLNDIVIASQAIEDSRLQAKWLSFVFNRIFEHLMSQQTNRATWNSNYRAFELSDKVVLAENTSNQILQLKLGYVKFSYFKTLDNGKKLPVFILQVKNKLAFSQPLPVDELVISLQGKNLYLPAFDQVKKSAVVVRYLHWRPIYEFLANSKKDRRNPNQKSIRYHELFVKYGRMTAEEAEKLTNAKSNFGIADVSFYQNQNLFYSYPAKDLVIVASDGLLTLRNDFKLDALPSKLVDMVNLYAEAKSVVIDDMANKTNLLEQASQALSQYFVLTAPVTCRQQIIKTPRFKFRKDEKTKQGIVNETYFYQDMLPKTAYGKLVLAYPASELDNPEAKQHFLSFFTGEGCKARKANLAFEVFDYSAVLAGKQPNLVVEKLLQDHPDCTGVLIGWTNWTTLINNKPIEFELIMRGIAVQHVVIEGKRKDAFKISSLIKGMQEKFPIESVANYRENIDLAPFDICMGLDISRHAGEDVASVPIAIDKYGMTHCCISESFVTEAKEKREISEIIEHINKVIDNYHLTHAKQNYEQQDKVNVLFLRDGIAYEDYPKITEALAARVNLTVVSLRKNLVAAASDELVSGDFSSIDGVLTEDLFVIGANARQGVDYKISQVHLAQIITKPSHISLGQIKNAVITLVGCNQTTESQMASLPMPIAYADRLAGDIRDFIQDRQLLGYVTKNYNEECNQYGGAKRFIYQTIQHFIKNRVNGEAFAI